MVIVKFFASIKQKIGKEEVSLNLDQPIAVASFLDILEKQLPGLKQAIKQTNSIIALNHQFVDQSATVKDGDELAFIPPMSGGQEMIRLQKTDFSIEKEIDLVRSYSRKIGGIVSFLGVAREFSRGHRIEELDFEHYPKMAEKKLAEIRQQALKDFNVLQISIVHRFGKIGIGDNIVLIVVGAEHRKEAFKACQWCIDRLKEITPIWKKEITSEGEIWVTEHP
jgi:molybdopterin synthase catalytic subunit